MGSNEKLLKIRINPWIMCKDKMPDEEYDEDLGISYSEDVKVLFNQKDNKCMCYIGKCSTINGNWDIDDNYEIEAWKKV